MLQYVLSSMTRPMNIRCNLSSLQLINFMSINIENIGSISHLLSLVWYLLVGTMLITDLIIIYKFLRPISLQQLFFNILVNKSLNGKIMDNKYTFNKL